MENKSNRLISDRLQGTDGIRSEARRVPFEDQESPQRTFLERQIITDRFMELYVFVWAKELKKTCKGKVVVVGWDPRDVEGVFGEAVVRGLRKAGMTVWVAGVIPTPLVAMLTISTKAVGGVMITASHNPKDQNGIKLFNGYRGMKSLPNNDRTLTRNVLNTSYEDMARRKQTGKRLDIRKEALAFFERFSLAEENSWVAGKSFRDIILVVDPANGSLSRIAADIFRKALFGRVIEVNHKLDGNVNVYGGVADLEGYMQITADMIDKSSGIFRRHRAILKLFELGRKNGKDIKKGRLRVCGAVFDADGDRFYMAEFDPYRDCLIILSGDETAIHQARYLTKLSKAKYGVFLNTVESDLNAGRAAEKEGFDSMLTPVGDKWLLSRIILAELKTRVGALEKMSAHLIRRVEKLEKKGILDLHQLAELETMITKLESNDKIFVLPVVIGSEETGHNITVGKLPKSPWSEGRETVFCGNGLKSALNTFSATQELFRVKNVRSFFDALEKPFSAGFKKTDYVYYVKKEKFYKNSSVWRAIRKCIETETQTLGWQARFISFPEDPDMLYCGLGFAETKNQYKESSALFVRNSGTENKIGVNLRGPKRESAKLKSVGERILRILIEKIKDLDNEWSQEERRLMQKMIVQPLDESMIALKADRMRRLLTEMKKQGLVELYKDGYRLTKRGKWVTIP